MPSLSTQLLCVRNFRVCNDSVGRRSEMILAVAATEVRSVTMDICGELFFSVHAKVAHIAFTNHVIFAAIKSIRLL